MISNESLINDWKIEKSKNQKIKKLTFSEINFFGILTFSEKNLTFI